MHEAKYIIIDLDGTLCNTDHRVDLILAKKYDEFHEKCVDDEPRRDVAEFLKLVSAQCKIMAVTGRNKKFEELTRRWLHKHNIIVDELLMRPNDDYTKDGEMKLKLIEEAFGGDKQAVLDNVMFALDDRDRVVEALRNYGLPTWQVKEGTY